jgi:hypothetical protein
MAGDFDGDGAVDIGAWSPDDHSFSIAFSTKSGFRDPVRWIAPGAAGGAENVLVYVGDVNGDRCDDLILHRSDLSIHAVTSTCRGFFGPNTGVWSMPGAFVKLGDQVRVGDFDGDGRADLARWDASARELWVSKSTGTGFGTPARWIGPGNGVDPAPVDFRVGDFDGDGHDDVLGRRVDGWVVLWLSYGSGVVGPYWLAGPGNFRGSEPGLSGQWFVLGQAKERLPLKVPTLVVGARTQTSVTLSWSAVPANHAVAGYDLYREDTRIAHGLSRDTTSFVDSGLSPGMSPCYHLRAYNRLGRVEGFATCTQTKPAMPPAVALSTAGVGETFIELRWALTGSGRVDGIHVYRDGTFMSNTSAGAVGITATGLARNRRYCFVAYTVNESGSTPSNQVCATTAQPQPSPSGSFTVVFEYQTAPPQQGCGTIEFVAEHESTGNRMRVTSERGYHNPDKGACVYGATFSNVPHGTYRVSLPWPAFFGCARAQTGTLSPVLLTYENKCR